MDVTASWIVGHTPSIHDATVAVSGGRVHTSCYYVALAYGMCYRSLARRTEFLAAMIAVRDHWLKNISIAYGPGSPRLDDLLDKAIRVLQIESGAIPLCALSDSELHLAAAHVDAAMAESEKYELEHTPTGATVGASVIRRAQIEQLARRAESKDADKIRPVSELRAFLDRHMV